MAFKEGSMGMMWRCCIGRPCQDLMHGVGPGFVYMYSYMYICIYLSGPPLEAMFLASMHGVGL